jgi:hypothetical protein
MKNEKIRKYFLEQKIPEVIDNSLSESLDKISLYNGKNLNLEKCMKDLSIIIDLNKVYNIKYIIEIGKEPENIQIVLEIIEWAKKTFSYALINGNLEKMILSYMIGDYLFLDPVIDFKWEKINENIEEKLKGLLKSIKVGIIVPENAPYSEKKYYDEYRNSLTGNSFRKIFDFLSAIDHGRGYDHRFHNFIKALVNICYKINPNLITEIISCYEPVLIKMVISNLNPYQAIKIFTGYNDDSSLPLLICLIHVTNPSWNNTYDTSLETNYDFIREASLLVKKISDRTETNNLYNYITDSSNIFGNRLWHSIFIAFAIQNPAFLDVYIDSIDFSIGFGAENVFETFCQFISDDFLIDDFSIKIYQRYLEYLSKERSHVRNYCGTNYLQFMIRAVYVKSEKSCIKYSKMLKEISIDFERALYSWDKKQITMHFTNLIFWILALSFYSDCYDTGEIDLSYTIAIFSSKKYLDAFNTKIDDISINYNVFIDFLKNPKTHIIIKLPLSYNSYTIIEFNKE